MIYLIYIIFYFQLYFKLFNATPAGFEPAHPEDIRFQV